jgi:BolA family transcriptional regulator, general stress-responsive regulator
MTEHYAKASTTPSSLDRKFLRESDCAAPVDPGTPVPYVNAMLVKDQIAEKLNAALAPQSLDVEDESQNHAGHAGHRPGGQTHFRVYIVSEAFRGKSRVERHRMINQLLSAELAGGVHALAIHASAPGE